jgi:hypothetical protein
VFNVFVSILIIARRLFSSVQFEFLLQICYIDPFLAMTNYLR